MISRSGTTLKYLFFFVCLVVIQITTSAAQTPELAFHPNPIAKPTPPVSYIYISQQPAVSGPNQVLGFAVAANGQLTSIKGSPFDASVGPMAVNGKYLFAGHDNPDGGGVFSIDTYAILANGALKFTVSNSVAPDPFWWDALFLDHTGTNLYGEMYDGNDCSFASFTINRASGVVTPAQSTDLGSECYMSFTLNANNEHIYAAYGGPYRPRIDALDIKNWTWNLEEPMPVAQPATVLEPYFISADPLNHVVGAFSTGAGALQLGVYTADEEGDLTTSSTYKNMPMTMLGPEDMKMSPSGKLLAVSGACGLQVFHFNGAKPITQYATLLKITNPPANYALKQLGWDSSNHLFALIGHQLHVFTVTPTSVTQAPGSPYTISGYPEYIAVQPLPL
jgi:hypothetical protein